MSGLGSLGSIGGAIASLARLGETIAGLFGRAQQRAAEQDQKAAGATAAENETIQDTAEISDAQARLNADHFDARDIARELRREADAAERGGPAGGAGQAGQKG